MFIFFPLPVLSYFLLVSTGFSSTGFSMNTEVVNLYSEDVQDLPTYQDYPIQIAKAVGGFVANQHFIVCGGFDLLFAIPNCYKIGTTNTSLIGRMKDLRDSAASIALPDRLWILGGGASVTQASLNRTEYILHDGRQEDGPDLPIPLHSHAAIQINESNFMIVGGALKKSSGVIDKTWLYSNGIWIDGPVLTKARYRHSVGKIRDPITQKYYIVVTGGISTVSGGGLEDLKSTEILEIDGTEWNKGEFNKV